MFEDIEQLLGLDPAKPAKPDWKKIAVYTGLGILLLIFWVNIAILSVKSLIIMGIL